MKTVRFCVEAPGAKRVLLAGDFTEWEENARPMRRSKPDGPFVAMVPLEEGPHEYKYIVDGQWLEDPVIDAVPNRFGTYNSSVVVCGDRAKQEVKS